MKHPDTLVPPCDQCLCYLVHPPGGVIEHLGQSPFQLPADQHRRKARVLQQGKQRIVGLGRKEKNRISLSDIGRGNAIPGGEAMPDGLKELVDRSLRLLERIKTLDMMISRQKPSETVNDNPVASQLDQLARAFGTR